MSTMTAFAPRQNIGAPKEHLPAFEHISDTFLPDLFEQASSSDERGALQALFGKKKKNIKKPRPSAPAAAASEDAELQSPTAADWKKQLKSLLPSNVSGPLVLALEAHNKTAMHIPALRTHYVSSSAFAAKYPAHCFCADALPSKLGISVQRWQPKGSAESVIIKTATVASTNIKDIARYMHEIVLMALIAQEQEQGSAQQLIGLHHFSIEASGNDIVFRIAMPDCTEGDLFGAILKHDFKDTKGNFFSDKDIMSVIRDMLQAVFELKKLGIVHRDIKPENIFLKRDAQGLLRAFIGDFDLAILPSSSKRPLTPIGTPLYMPFQDWQPYSFGAQPYKVVNMQSRFPINTFTHTGNKSEHHIPHEVLDLYALHRTLRSMFFQAYRFTQLRENILLNKVYENKCINSMYKALEALNQNVFDPATWPAYQNFYQTELPKHLAALKDVLCAKT